MKTKMALMVLALCFGVSAQAKKLSDYQPYEYDIRFTNPECKLYQYAQPIASVSGGNLTAKPKNTYCTRADYGASANRPLIAPQYKMLEWINHPDTTEIFFAFLSFSNSVVAKALCNVIENRNVKVTFVLDQGQDQSVADEVLKCKPKNNDPNAMPRKVLRGGTGGIIYAHNKIIFINPHSPKYTRIAFGSGNLSSGTVLHHENWHFITTSPASYFAQKHVCLMNGMLDHGDSKVNYSSYIASCKKQITAPEEEDIKTFFIPGEGNAAYSWIQKSIAASDQVGLAAHRFSNFNIKNWLGSRLSTDKTFKLRMVMDDDTYWVGTTGVQTGDNTLDEYVDTMQLVKVGGLVEWMETNHHVLPPERPLLHHNKYLVFSKKGIVFGVFGGAGNLTGSAFVNNYENFYYIMTPSVLSAFQRQYEHVWNDLATVPANMPAKDTKPTVAVGVALKAAAEGKTLGPAHTAHDSDVGDK